MFKLAIVIAGCFASFLSSAQNKKDVFEIAPPTKRVGSALYNSIRVVDLRNDPTNYGLIQTGVFNRPRKIIVETPLEEQLQKLVSRLSLGTLRDGELVLLLRHFSFAEIHPPFLAEKGYCYLKAGLYAGREGQYRRLDGIDTAILVKAFDVTQPMLHEGNKILTDFIADNLIKSGQDSVVYSYDELYSIEKIEKAKLPAYNTISYPNGLYATYEDFVNLRPRDAKLKVDISKKGVVKSVMKENDKGKLEELNSNDVYAFAFDSKPYIATEYGYYLLQRKVGDFYFTGKVRNLGNEPEIISAAYFFGILGSLIATNSSSYYEIKIDYQTGNFIRLRQAQGL